MGITALVKLSYMQVSLSRKLMNILCNYNILSTLKDKLASQGEFKPASVAYKHMYLENTTTKYPIQLSTLLARFYEDAVEFRIHLK